MEIVSNQKGNEIGRKRDRYAGMGVSYYVIHAPLHQVMDDDLRIYRLSDGRYERQESPRFPELRLGLTLWDGVFEAVRSRWLRWIDEQGLLIPTGHEQRQRADREHQRAERLAALLRRSGIDPEQELDGPERTVC